MRPTRTALCASIAAATACSHVPVVCPAILGFAIDLTVVDSITGARPNSVTNVIWTVGAHTDSVTNIVDPTTNRFSIGAGYAGLFSLTAKTAGYRAWTDSVMVTADNCDIPNLVSLTARLQR